MFSTFVINLIYMGDNYTVTWNPTNRFFLCTKNILNGAGQIWFHKNKKYQLFRQHFIIHEGKKVWYYEIINNGGYTTFCTLPEEISGFQCFDDFFYNDTPEGLVSKRKEKLIHLNTL